MRSMTVNCRRILSLIFLLTMSSALSGCWFFDFFDKGAKGGGGSGSLSGTIAGQPLSTRAGIVDEAALAEVHAVTTEYSPAAIRPDPDTYVRQMLKQYRSPGATIARQIGNVEAYRLLLGGASEDFTKVPQESYDATSLLTTFAVAQQYCVGLVSPNSSAHSDWSTILPYAATDEESNVIWLAQRFLGIKSTEISADKIAALLGILDSERDHVEFSSGDFDKYIPVCSALALDAEALFL